MRCVTAFSPGHVTGLFYMQDLADDPLYSGSLGSGFSLEKGAFTTVTQQRDMGPHLITINSEKNSEAPVSRRVIDLFFEKTGIPPSPLDIVHRMETPQGAGFGSSGSGVLSLVFALNRIYGDPLNFTTVAQLAHIAEVQCRTGLGTVMGETMGGFKVLIEPGAPGIGKTISIPHPENICAAFIVFGPYSTSKALSDPLIRKSIMESGKKYHNLIKENPDLGNFREYSRAFAESTGIIPASVRFVLDELDRHNINSSMLMFGEGTFSIMEKQEAEKMQMLYTEIIRKMKSDKKPELFFSNIAKEGVGIVSED